MNDPHRLAEALTLVELTVQQMAEAGIGPIQRAIALGIHMQSQADLAMPTPEAAAIFKLSIGNKR